MNNAAELQTSKKTVPDNRKGRVRDMPTPKQMPVLDFLVEEAAANDEALEEAIVITVAGIKDKSIQSEVGQELLVNLFAIFKNNDHMHDVLSMFRDGAIELPLAEIERVRAVRRKLASGVKK